MRLLAFPAGAAEWLARDPRTHNVLLTRLPSVERSWLVAGDDGEPLLALGLNAGQPLILSGGGAEAARFAAGRLDASGLSGMAGPAEPAQAFAAQYAERYAVQAVLHMTSTFYTLDRPPVGAPPPGELRQAAADDFHALYPLARDAMRAMNLPPSECEPAHVAAALRRRLAAGQQFCWHDSGGVRALASYAPALAEGGARITFVYTPPELRGRGYGAAVTTALCQRLFAAGQSWVCLYADQASPAANRLYLRLGFQPHHTAQMWRFE